MIEVGLLEGFGISVVLDEIFDTEDEMSQLTKRPTLVVDLPFVR